MYRRRDAREQAFHIIFEKMFNDETVSSIARMAEEYRELDIIPFGKKIAKYAIENEEIINELISRYSRGWSIDRISKVSLAILKMAISEMLYIEGVPQIVIINEALEISKDYVSPKETGFIHGILGSIVDNKAIEDKESAKSEAEESEN